MVPWAHKSKLSNGISIGTGILAQHVHVTNTDRQTTLLVTSVAIGRIYVLCACDVAYK